MLKSQFKVAFRAILNQKYYSLINILGLAIGLAAVTIIGLFVRHELSFDRHNEDVDRIHRIVRNEYVLSPPPMASTLKANISEIQFTSRFIMNNNVLAAVGEKYFTEAEYFWTDNEFLTFSLLNFFRVIKKPQFNRIGVFEYL